MVGTVATISPAPMVPQSVVYFPTICILATISVFTFLSTWNEMMFAITFINSEKYRTLTVGIMQMVGQYTTDWGTITAWSGIISPIEKNNFTKRFAFTRILAMA